MAERIRKIGDKLVGEKQPTFVIAEIGINHNGSVELAKKMIAGAAAAGADAVKFQKRTPEICVPKDQWDIERDTPWGRMKYIDYRYKTEFGEEEYSEIDKFCKSNDIMWTASCWDIPSVEFIEKFGVPFHKAPSAALTDIEMLKRMAESNIPVMISSGMSTLDHIQNAIDEIGKENLLLAHSTSTYPCKLEELNLRVITTLRDKYPDIPIGYSGHETGLAPSWAAVVLGADFLERHITLDRAMWGSDQAASVEIGGFIRLISNIRDIEKAMGDGIKKIYDSEVPIMKKLRKVLA